MRYLVSYDIPVDRRRQHVAKLLEGYGFRVQYSVFECELTIALIEEVKERLGALIQPEEDSIRIYPLCRTCVHGLTILGQREPAGIHDKLYLF